MSSISRGVFRTPEGSIRKPNSAFIPTLCLIALGLIIVGFINLYSATSGGSHFWHQLRNLPVTLAAFVIFGWLIPLRKVKDYTIWFYLIVVTLLIVVLLLGRVAGGSQRWLSIGPIGFQPSEFAKLAMALMVANFFSNHRQQHPYRLRELIPVFCLAGLLFGLIFLQPDFGTAGMCLIIMAAQLAFIRIDWRSIAIVALSSPILATITWQFLLLPYQKARILTVLNPTQDPQNAGYNSLQSLIAIGSGSVFGKGFMQGTQAQLRFLPERHTDFVFSVFAEEHGFWGATLVFLGFSAITYIGLEIARTTKDTFSGLLAVGLAAFIFMEFTINIAMVLGVFPVVGLPLPFFSYGSSLLLSICVALGLLVSIDRNSSGLSKH